MPKLVRALFFLFLFMLLSFFAFSQVNKQAMVCDSAIILTSNQFDSVVTESLALLNTKKISAISADEHRAIIRSFNTIWMFEFHPPKFKKSIYGELMAKLQKDNYSTELAKLYPDWCPNRGMGMYFFKLNIEYGGTPCSWNYFTIKD